MKKIFLFSVIILSAFNIYASTKWFPITTSSDGNVFFIDTNSIQKSGDSYTYWVKLNFSNRDVDGLSSKSQRSINCRTRETIARYIINYEDIDNSGKIISSFSPTRGWIPIAPESVNSAFYDYLCDK